MREQAGSFPEEENQEQSLAAFCLEARSSSTKAPSGRREGDSPGGESIIHPVWSSQQQSIPQVSQGLENVVTAYP